MRNTIVLLATLAAISVCSGACGGGVIVTTEGSPPPEGTSDGKSSLTTFYASVKLDGSQCLPRSLDRMCRVLVVSSRCVGEEGLRESEPSDAEAVAGLTTIAPGTRVCELAQMSPGLCLSRRAPAWCYVAGSCAESTGPACEHALCPSLGAGPTLAALGPAFLACEQ